MCPAFKSVPKDSQWELCVSVASHAGIHSLSSNGENAIEVNREISSATEHSLTTHAGLARTNYPIKVAERWITGVPAKRITTGILSTVVVKSPLWEPRTLP